MENSQNRLSFGKMHSHFHSHKSLYCIDCTVLTIRFHSTGSIFNNWHYFISAIFFSWGEKWEELRRKLVRRLVILSLWKQKEGARQHINTLPSHRGLGKVTEILFLESLTFDLSDSCNLPSLQMCLWASTATLKLWLKSCIISPYSQLPLC